MKVPNQQIQRAYHAMKESNVSCKIYDLSLKKYLGIQWAMWSKWSRPDNKCEGRRFRQCQNCLADGTCTPIPKFKQSCAGERFETLFYTNKPACSKLLQGPKS